MSRKIWYVYKILFENGKFYYGYRGADDPTADFLVRYTSSSKIVKKLISEGVVYSGEIIKTFDAQHNALDYEQQLIYENFSNPLIINRACRFGVNGFGLLTSDAKTKIRKESKARWADPEYRQRLSETHKKRWAENPELREKQISRMKGKARPEHSAKMKGRTLSDEAKQNLRKPKHSGHGKKVSESLKGKIKTDTHKRALAVSHQRPGVFVDHCNERYVVHRDFLKKYNLDPSFFDNLDARIRYRRIYEKLGIEYEQNKLKTKAALGFRFE